MYVNERIDLPSGTIAYRTAGPADGPVVVFVHGFLVDSTLWDGVAERLVAQGHRCFLPDWPLGSHRLAQTVAPTPRGVAATIVAFLEALDLSDVTLVGNDTGGAMCQFTLDTDASRIGRLVLTNCDAFDTFPPGVFALLFRMFRHPGLAKVGLRPMRSRAVRHSALGFGLLAKELDAEQTLAWIQPALGDPAIRADIAAFCKAVRPADLLDVSTRLSAFEGPVRMIWGEGDRFFKPALGRRLAETFPNAVYEGVPGALTFLPLENPDAVAQAVVATGASVNV